MEQHQPRVLNRHRDHIPPGQQPRADGKKLYRHILTVKEEEGGWWICEDDTPLEGPFITQDRAIAAVESV